MSSRRHDDPCGASLATPDKEALFSMCVGWALQAAPIPGRYCVFDLNAGRPVNCVGGQRFRGTTRIIHEKLQKAKQPSALWWIDRNKRVATALEAEMPYRQNHLWDEAPLILCEVHHADNRDFAPTIPRRIAERGLSPRRTRGVIIADDNGMALPAAGIRAALAEAPLLDVLIHVYGVKQVWSYWDKYPDSPHFRETAMLPLHELAVLFPEMSAVDFATLKASLEARGQEEPIVLYDGKVLDGRNRAKACHELGITPKTTAYEGDDPLGYVIAKNFARRHLTESQRSMVAGRIATLKQGRPEHNGKDVNSRLFIRQAAALMQVGGSSVEAARVVLASADPSIVRAVERGDLAVSAARQLAVLPAKRQQTIALMTDERERRTAVREAKAEAATVQSYERAARAPLVLTSVRATLAPAERSYSVAEWERLNAKTRADIIAAGFECSAKMNDQPSDAIEWARRSLNTVTGCLHDCPYCYARDIAERVYPQKFAPTFHPSRLSAPSREPVPPEARQDTAFKNVFANSMSDLFGAWVPKDWIEATIAMAERNQAWNFLTLTKFPQRAAEFDFPRNWWMGTTVDAQARVANAERAFAKIRCGLKWLSVEPLLQPLTFTRLDLFQWIVIGGASASRTTPAWQPPIKWILDLHHAAEKAGLKIYDKTNCGPWETLRERQFPGVDEEAPRLPKSMRYLKGL